jgi:hypothetical protein
MVLQTSFGNVTPDKGADKKDGADVAAADYDGANSGAWWSSTAGFPTESWEFANNGKLPILKGFNQPQNPTVTP